ncbi:ribosomal protein S12 methylthiotransferase RimO [Synergistales bacterium]|nr:ribosomal protein S12 methylthiotransferase RimO [Synergistales bacterium]
MKEHTVYCLSLGCSKNTADSEKMAALLREAGYEIVPEPEDAEVCLINTCGFIEAAVTENISEILEAAELKAKGSIKRIVVVGCLVNRYGEESLRRDIPEVDSWCRTENGQYDAIIRAVTGRGGSIPACARRLALPGSMRHVRYLKISDGCDNRCSYCAIPSIRGSLRSVPIKEIVAEAEDLVSDGAVEICLVAQDLTAYGSDRGREEGLIELIDALECSLPRDVWLRPLYLQPKGVTRALLERIAAGRQVLPYLDIPIQHASPKILSAMNRPSDADALLDIFLTARKILPDFALRTTCMLGFPGESRKDVAQLMRFLRTARIDRVGAFVFSPEEGTAAADMPEQVPEKTKIARLERLMTAQREISLMRQGSLLWRTLDVVVDDVLPDGTVEGRSFREAPDVDGVIEIQGAKDVRAGDRIRARVNGVFEHDMLAEYVP